MISVQRGDFDHCEQYQALKEEADGDGAVVTFTGLVRDFNIQGAVSGIRIEHYPGMTEKSLMHICSEARKRWQLGQIRVIHRVGTIGPQEQIVFVGVTSKHRKNAFEACEFIIDYLKTSAPLWKQEGTSEGMKWVTSRSSDQEAMDRWANTASLS
ncbi:molybdopterin synthase catalytic subunit MoaE [Alteromonas mediterranea]|uniref:Molybdopterin synthase catalytic subunit n=1 Tax=Alteromonas mediterranea (strain DSM 17117 / CIP 110805 / LMG 28347 / Deep ecotype) TaxID=1774373 RepID=F2GAM3_ALTMD|nr:molybdopterin synthase catalytic subunit MoaE [Alteromonas mediterranea]AEA99987.1 molybdenum cofactor biosynthesis protein MoaE [Alteromonas mediterranea DE]CAH1189142.1 Molybdopterin synthase catalytic subunit [Alteromonas mediterranea]|tara:strand:+ start:1499 stop:1963 length:465 start_codon:yes stop_codon:yes gene_type:complete